jgi:acyl carrier protein
MTREPTLDGIVELVEVHLGERGVRPDDRLVEDLGAVSMDLVHIAVAIEDCFGCFLDDVDLARCRTVRDLHAAVSRAAHPER